VKAGKVGTSVAALAAFVALAVGLANAEGCSSSSSPPPPADSGPDGDDVTVTDAEADGPASCNPIFDSLCGSGETCCVAGLTGTCVAVGSCKAPIQVSCIAKSQCGGDICCGSVQLPAGFDAAAAFDGGFDASAFDASGFSLSIACATTCAQPDFQLCTTSTDCPPGYRCAGGAMNNLVGIAGIVACIPEDAGAPPPPDAGTDAGDGSAPPADAGTDAGDGG
jgi:hypothetical protein